MFGTQDLALFIVAGLLLNITPGADFLYIVGRSAGQDFVAGVWAALGVDAGSSGKVGAFLLLGLAFTVNGTLWNILVAGAAAQLAGKLDAASRVGTWLNRTLGVFFVGLGVRLAVSERG